MSISREEVENGQFKWTDPDIDMHGSSLAAVHPGEVLRGEFMEPESISGYRLAADIHVPNSRIVEITAGRRAMTADTALRLSRYFGTSAAFWMNLQTAYDLETATRAHGQKIAREVCARVDL